LIKISSTNLLRFREKGFPVQNPNWMPYLQGKLQLLQKPQPTDLWPAFGIAEMTTKVLANQAPN